MLMPTLTLPITHSLVWGVKDGCSLLFRIDTQHFTTFDSPHYTLLIAILASISMFHNFNNLPTEIRQWIWQLTIDIEPEVCLPWPLNTCIGYSETEPRDYFPQLPLTVDTAFPVAMHVCRDSRVAILHPKSGMRFRASKAAGCPTPFREYIPEYDTLYLSQEMTSMATIDSRWLPVQVKAMQGSLELQQTWLDLVKRATSLAFEGPNLLLLGEYMREMLAASALPDENGAMPAAGSFGFWPRQKRLSMVVPCSTYDERGIEWQRAFKGPGRRCKLVPVSGEALQKVHIIPDDSHRPGDVEAVTLERALRLARENIYGWEDWRDWDLPPDKNLEIVAQTFVEYQPDGSWTEVCKDRIFEPITHKVLFAVSEPVPSEDRPDPEQVRGMDQDIKFNPWIWADDYGAI